MKKKISSIAVMLAILLTASSSYATVNNDKMVKAEEKITKNFTKEFSIAPAIAQTDQGFMASSVIDGRKVDAAYSKNGNWKYTVVRYGYDNLDKKIVDLVKKNNFDKYFISSMEKIDQAGFQPVYFVHLVSTNSIKTLKIAGDNWELTQDLTRI